MHKPRKLKAGELERYPASKSPRKLVVICPKCGRAFQARNAHADCRGGRKHPGRRLSLHFAVEPEELEELLGQLPVNVVARLLGISTQSVQKSCKQFGIDLARSGDRR